MSGNCLLATVCNAAEGTGKTIDGDDDVLPVAGEVLLDRLKGCYRIW
jgi:hypothetical protein